MKISAEESKVITCILSRGEGLPLLEKLHHEKGLTRVQLSRARGIGRSTPLGRRGLHVEEEKDVLSVVVAAEEADAIFEYLYWEAGLDQPRSSLLYVHATPRSTSMEGEG